MVCRKYLAYRKKAKLATRSNWWRSWGDKTCGGSWCLEDSSSSCMPNTSYRPCFLQHPLSSIFSCGSMFNTSKYLQFKNNTCYYSQFILPDRQANITKITLRQILLILFIPDFWSGSCLKCLSVYLKTHGICQRDGPFCPLWWWNIWWREGRHCDRNVQCRKTLTVTPGKPVMKIHLLDSQPVEEIQLHDFVGERSWTWMLQLTGCSYPHQLGCSLHHS